MYPRQKRTKYSKRHHRHWRQAKLRAIDQRKAAKKAPAGVSLFEHSRDVRFNRVQINVRNIDLPMNSNQSAMNHSHEDDDVESPANTSNPRRCPVMENERSTTPISDLSSLPVQRRCDIYYRYLAVKGRGSPMFLPEPSSTLPDIYRRQGIAIGDVGVLTASGGFDFMFNICLPADHPINQQGLPEGFSPISPPLHPSDVHRHMEFRSNTYLSSASVKRSRRETDSLGITFESSASEGAVLTMPHGAYAENAANVSRFRKYVSANLEGWYRYVNNVRGREARNGDVRLVVGCDKAASWGMATFENSTAQDFHLKFNPTGEGDSSQTYGWEYSGTVEARAGPDPSETEELRSSDDSGYLGVYKNQGLFVRTINPTLGDSVWQGLGFDFETPMDVQSDSFPRAWNPNPSSGPSTTTTSPTGASNSNSTTRARSVSSTTPGNAALVAHLSKTLNDFMLAAHPDARMAMTEDDDWSSLIRETDQQLPPPEELINRMLSTYDICEADGVVFLRLKQEDADLRETDASLHFLQDIKNWVTHAPDQRWLRHLKSFQLTIDLEKRVRGPEGESQSWDWTRNSENLPRELMRKRLKWSLMAREVLFMTFGNRLGRLVTRLADRCFHWTL